MQLNLPEQITATVWLLLRKVGSGEDSGWAVRPCRLLCWAALSWRQSQPTTVRAFHCWLPAGSEVVSVLTRRTGQGRAGTLALAVAPASAPEV